MPNPTLKWVAAGTAVAVAMLGGRWLLSGPAPRLAQVSGSSEQTPVRITATDSGAHSYAVVSGTTNPGTFATRGTAPTADNLAARRAREVFLRLRDAVGNDPMLPAELRADLLAFLTEGDDQRDALFRMAWDPGSSRMILGHLRLFLMGLEDEGTRIELLAALDALNPDRAAIAEAKRLSCDPGLLAAQLGTSAPLESRLKFLENLPEEAAAEPAVAR
ncbi:MAG TPA: hypothetical protein VGC81_09700, partial [Candidatus Methylomirabilis sp.]